MNEKKKKNTFVGLLAPLVLTYIRRTSLSPIPLKNTHKSILVELSERERQAKRVTFYNIELKYQMSTCQIP